MQTAQTNPATTLKRRSKTPFAVLGIAAVALFICNDCANTAAASNSQRVFRGGSAGNDASYLLSSTRYGRDPADHNGFVGLRCARSP